MYIVKSIANNETEYPNPLKLTKGELVKLGEYAPEENWKDWIWTENAQQEGEWVPIKLIAVSIDSNQGTVLEDYSAKELSVVIGESFEKIKSLNGWSWVKRISNQEEGWIPNEIISE